MSRIVNVTRGQLLASHAEVARSFAERCKGLLGRRGWGEIDGLWIEPCSGVHALGMRFPIEVVLLDGGLVAIGIQRLCPWRFGRIDLEAQVALELPAGTVERTGTRKGDRISLEGPQDRHAL